MLPQWYSLLSFAFLSVVARDTNLSNTFKETDTATALLWNAAGYQGSVLYAVPEWCNFLFNLTCTQSSICSDIPHKWIWVNQDENALNYGSWLLTTSTSLSGFEIRSTAHASSFSKMFPKSAAPSDYEVDEYCRGHGPAPSTARLVCAYTVWRNYESTYYKRTTYSTPIGETLSNFALVPITNAIALESVSTRRTAIPAIASCYPYANGLQKAGTRTMHTTQTGPAESGKHSKSAGLSEGAKIGIGVGVGVGCLALIGIGAFTALAFFRNRRKSDETLLKTSDASSEKVAAGG